MSKNQKPTRKLRSLGADQWKPEKPGDIIEGIIFDTGTRLINHDFVPFVQLEQDGGDTIIEILLGAFTLERLYHSQKLKDGYYLMLRYDGESKSIKKASNAMKLYSYYLEDSEGNEIIIKDKDLQGEESNPLDMTNIGPENVEEPGEDDLPL